MPAWHSTVFRLASHLLVWLGGFVGFKGGVAGPMVGMNVSSAHKARKIQRVRAMGNLLQGASVRQVSCLTRPREPGTFATCECSRSLASRVVRDRCIPSAACIGASVMRGVCCDRRVE